MGRRGTHKSDYNDPSAGTQTHLILTLLRSPRGLTSREATEFGLLAHNRKLACVLIYLRDQCGYDYRAIAWERNSRRRGRDDVRFIVTARYNWNGTVAEDYMAVRANRRVQQLA